MMIIDHEVIQKMNRERIIKKFRNRVVPHLVKKNKADFFLPFECV